MLVSPCKLLYGFSEKRAIYHLKDCAKGAVAHTDLFLEAVEI